MLSGLVELGQLARNLGVLASRLRTVKDEMDCNFLFDLAKSAESIWWGWNTLGLSLK
jgi:hypothetical protein